MISNIKGKLIKKEEQKVYIESGNFVYEVLMPKSAMLRLDDYMEDGFLKITTYYYFQGDQRRSYPVLIGFLTDIEKEFFSRILKVAGIGPKAAVKVLDKPISEIAKAIDEANIDYLKKLSGVGMQRAKNMVAFLQGKVGKFVLIKDKVQKTKETKAESENEELIRQAVQVMGQLQYKKTEARLLIDKAFKFNPQINSLEELLNCIYMQNPTKQ